VEQVLEQYRRIAFTSLHDLVEWDHEGMKLKPDADTTAIIEIVTGAKNGKPYRIKLHDKKAVLDALARAIGVVSQKAGANGTEEADYAEEAHEFLIQELDRQAAEIAREEGGQEGPR